MIYQKNKMPRNNSILIINDLYICTADQNFSMKIGNYIVIFWFSAVDVRAHKFTDEPLC